MTRFSLKDILRGITLTAIGLAMLVAASKDVSGETSLWRAFLIHIGGMFVGYGLAFSVKWPPYQYICAMIGMFAAQAWFSGSRVGLIFFVGVTFLMGVASFALGPPAKKGAERDDELKRGEK